MNILPPVVRMNIIEHLVEGNSIRATARLLKVDKDAVMYLGVRVGLGCMYLHDRIVRGIHMALGEVDEVWAYVGRHEKRLRAGDPPEWGDAYTLSAIDTVTKLIVAYLTGPRDLDTATAFMFDLRRRIVGKPHLSVDGWIHWQAAVRRAFGYNGCDLGCVIKEYQAAGSPDDPERRYSPGRIRRIEKAAIFGEPDLAKVSTSLAERANLTARMGQRRLTRLTNAYSKKRENLVAAIGLHTMHYNFVREHTTIGTTPAVRAGLAAAPWSVAELLREALDAKPCPPVPAPPVPRDPVTGDPLPVWATWQPPVQPNLLDVDALPGDAWRASARDDAGTASDDDGPPTVRDPDPWRG
jgi:IS1 family transposase